MSLLGRFALKPTFLCSLDRLEQNGGVCIIATHLGKGFVRNDAVKPAVSRILTEISRRNGWFIPVSPLFDFLKERRQAMDGTLLPKREWNRMQLLWAYDLVARRVAAVLRTRG